MTKIKKILVVSCIIIVTLIMNFLGLANSVYAAELGGSVPLQNSGDCGTLLEYQGVPIKVTYITYNENGKEYPAYCLNRELPGVETSEYAVSVNQYVTDVGLWRRIINGYPYKTISELGCATKEEAFSATKQAVYCYIYGNDIEDYSPVGEAGERTLNAMRQIISNAENSQETKLQSTITIDKNLSTWKEDDLDKTYISKTYQVEANSDYKNYTISLEKLGKSTLPEGIKIATTKNKEQTTFSKGEKFKILIPIRNLNNNGDFKINIESQLNTKPILYGTAPSADFQDYALTTLQYEEGKSYVQDSYGENKTKIIVQKQDKNTQKPLEGVTFDLLDSNKKVIYSGLKTDANGQIIIKKVMPGKYYLVETSTLDGYVMYDEEIEIEVELNEEFKVTVNNSKETKVEIEKTEKEVSVEKQAKAVEIKKQEVKETVKKLPVTGM